MNSRLIPLFIFFLGLSTGYVLSRGSFSKEGTSLPPLYDQLIVGLEHEPRMLENSILELIALEESLNGHEFSPQNTRFYSQNFVPQSPPLDEKAIVEYVNSLSNQTSGNIRAELNEAALLRKERFLNFLLIRAYQQNTGYLERLEASLIAAEAYPPGSGIPITDLVTEQPYRSWLEALPHIDLGETY